MNSKHKKRKQVNRSKARRITLGWIVAMLSLAVFAAMAVFLTIDVMRGNSAADKQAESVITPPSVATRTGAAPEPHAGGARLWLSETQVDLGNVPFMTPVSYSFDLENVGDALLVISQPSVQMLEGC